MNKLTLKAETRKLSGRKVKKLRLQGFIPANIYGRKFKSHSIQVDKKDFEKVFSEAGETGLVEIIVDKEKKPVLIHNLQKEPVSDAILHVDFLQVDLKQKVSAMVPVVLVGESPAEKQSLGTVVQYFTEIEVEALPEDLPDKFEVDLSKLSEVDHAVQVKDIKVDPSKVEIKKDVNEIIVKVEPPKEEKEEVAPAAEVAVEVESQTLDTEKGTPEAEGESGRGEDEKS